MMDDLNLSRFTISEELVGIIGMLDSREGSTLKDITVVLESLHGPVRQDLIHEGLKTAMSSGLLVCKNRRYKVCKKNINNMGSDSTFYSRDDASSVSTVSAQVDEYLEEVPTPSESEHHTVHEILSARSIPSTDQLSMESFLDALSSKRSLIDSKVKQRKTNAKKHLIVKLPVHKKKLAVEDVVKRGNSSEEVEKTEGTLLDDTEKNKGKYLPVKRSLNDVMTEVMKQFTDCKKSDVELHDAAKEVANKEERGGETQVSCDGISKIMTQIMEKVNMEHSDSLTTPELLTTEVGKRLNNVKHSDCVEDAGTSSRDEENSRAVSNNIAEIMKRISSREEPQNKTLPMTDNDESTGKTQNRRVGTESQDIGPSCSGFHLPKSGKREKRVNRHNTSSKREDGYRYMTRSRKKANELRSPCDSETSSKRAKLS